MQQEFMTGMRRLPFLTDFMRAEACFRDYEQPSRKTEISTVQFKFFTKQILFLVNFKKQRSQNQHDQIQWNEQQNYFTIETGAIHLEDTFADVRQRITNILNAGYKLNQDIRRMSQRINIIEEFQKLNVVLLAQSESENDESRLKEFDRLSRYFKEGQREQKVFKFDYVRFETNLLASYDCFSTYRHADGSQEWRPCKILSKDQKSEGASARARTPTELECAFLYEIEFKHQAGQGLTYKRERKDILMSARVAQQNQRSFDSECFKFIADTYQDVRVQQEL